MDQIERQLRDAIEGRADRGPKGRLKIYQAATNAISTLPANIHAARRAQISAAIRNIENDYGEISLDSTNTEFKASENSVPDPVIAGDKKSETGRTGNAESLAYDSDEVTETVALKNRTSNFSIGKYIIAACVLIAAIALSALYAYDIVGSTNSVFSSAGEGSAGGETEVSGKAGTKPVETLVHWNTLDDDISQFSRNPRESADNEALQKFFSDGELIIKPGQVFSAYVGPNISIDTSKIYILKLELEALGDSEKMPRVNAGFMTFDSKGRIQREEPGPNRYFARGGSKKSGIKVDPNGNWIISGTITGEGNDSHSEFRHGTKSAKVFVGINNKSGENQIKLLKTKLSVTK